MSLAYRPPFRAPLAALALLAGLCAPFLTACNDDIACVFTTGCQEEPNVPGPIATSPAQLPVDGQWIVSGAPRVSATFPSGGGDVADTTPIVITFSESMQVDSLTNAFRVTPTTGSAPTLRSSLVGDGRVLVLLPLAPLPEDDYVVELIATTPPTDLTGQELSVTGPLASFTVVDPAPSRPVVVATYPRAPANAVSQTGQIVVVFDRPLVETSVTADSFDVTVDGADPVPDPDPAPLAIGGGEDTRVYTYRVVDNAGQPVPLGADLPLSIALSVGGTLRTTDGGQLAPTTVNVRTAPFSAPLAASLLSTPPDAIGIENLTPGSNQLTLQLDLADGSAGDFVDLFFFGLDPDEMTPTTLRAFLRSIRIAGGDPIVSATFGFDDIDFTSGSGADTARVADGAVSFAVSVRRGTDVSPLRVLDADPGRPGIQDLLLDTVAPTIVELFDPTAGDLLRSDQRGVVLWGTASEPLSSVAVDVPGVGDNLIMGNPPPVVGSDSSSGLFVAAPVGADLLAPGATACSAIAYDRAGNPSPTVDGFFVQQGALGAGAFTPGDSVTVEVFDAVTLEPVAGALVALHADMGNGVDFPFTAAAVTVADGTASLTSAAAAATLLSVDAAGYDLFTFQGLTSSRASVGLWPIGAGPSASVEGDVGSQSSLANLLGVLDLKVSDTRLAPDAVRSFATEGCLNFLGILACPFLGRPIRPQRLGATSVIAGDFQLGPTGFTAETLVQAFELQVPRPPVASGQTDSVALDIPFLFIESGLDPTEQPIEIQSTFLDATQATAPGGIDPTMLEDDAATTGTPHVTLETLLPGLQGPSVVGLGLAFETSMGATTWTVRAAHPGAVTGGFYAENGVVDPDLFLRAELRDVSGNRSLRRPRLSQLSGLPTTGSPPLPVLELPAVPAVTLDGTSAAGGGIAYDFSVDDVLPDALGLGGLVELRLSDTSGRAWHVWLPDPPDGLDPVAVHVPDLAAAGGSRLLPGDLRASVEVWAWEGLDPAAFLWSDLEREHEAFVAAAEVTFAGLP